MSVSIQSQSPNPRKTASLSEQNLNLDNVNFPLSEKALKAKKRGASSFGGKGVKLSDELSPRREARRTAKPRKSILKPRNEDTDETVQFAHTVNFSASQTLISRRVSFAPNAHVRMFETPAIMSPDGTPAPAPGTTFALPPPSSSNKQPRSSLSTHSRRSSITNLNSVSKQNIFVPSTFQGEGEDQGEESMDIEDDSNSESEDEGTVELGRQPGRPQVNITFDNGANAGESDEEADEEEMDMDITQNVYGGIIRRSSMPAADTTVDSDITEEADITTKSADDEKTMDFTIAVGGLLPPQAPKGAMSNRNSIGYNFPIPEGSSAQNFRPGDAIEGEVEIEMEETVAFGGIIGPDDTISSGEDTIDGVQRERTMTFTFNHHVTTSQQQQQEDDGMDMTVAQGGIINLPPVSPAFISPYPPTSPGRSLPTNTRPMAGTPSFARPTASSIQRSRERETATSTQKRNVFAPSPSPTKSTSPKKAGMQVAGEVAKRLSFGSTTSSPSKKRSREAIENEGNDNDEAKKSKPDSQIDNVVEEVFGGTPVSHPPQRTSLVNSRLSLSAPRTSLGTPMRIARSPASRQSLVRVADPEPEPEPELVNQVEEEPEWEQPPTISLGAFLEMTGVQFMEGLPGLNRRSSVAKGILGRSYAGGEREFALHEYAEANVNSVFMNMYTWAANKVRDDVRAGQLELEAIEARCDEDSPTVIQEYLAASDEDRPLFESTFKTFKTNTQLKAKELWYDWKLQLMQTMKPDVEHALEGMQEDNERLASILEETESILPDLKARQAALLAELEKEREIVAEIAACDQQELAQLKEAITDQGHAIDLFSTELEESTTKLQALTTKLEELNATKTECINAISSAKSQCDLHTKSDAIRLQEEYMSIQHLHLWRPTKIHPTLLELEFDNEILLTFNCREYIADLSSAQIRYLHEKVQLRKSGPIVKGSNKQTPSEGLFSMLEIALSEMVDQGTCTTLSSLVQTIGQLWSTSQRLRAELHYVNFRYPMNYKFQSESNSLVASVTIILPNIKSKVLVEIIISPDTIYGYPYSLKGSDVEVRGVYGKPDIEELNQIAKDTLMDSVSQGFSGTFLQVCFNVASQYIK